MANPKGHNTPVTMYDHYLRVYQHMKDNAVPEEVQEGETLLVWEGFTTGLFKELELPVPYYTYILGALEETKMIGQLRRGGGKVPSRWWINPQPAPREVVMDALQNKRASYRRPSKTSQLTQQVKDLDERIVYLEKQIDILLDVVQGLVDGDS